MSSVIDPTHSSTRSSQALQTQLGQRYILLDSVRDANFLNKSSTDGLGNNISDMGLGVVDNGLFVYTTKFTPGSPTVARPYPVKFFWLGSPAGTTDANDNFAIFMADVNQSAFYPGAPASAWLVNPRLVLSYQQAKNDIVAWFDANYPGGGTNGVGNTGTGSNSVYGTLSGDNSNPGNVSGMNSIDGQFHPIYDIIDQSLILYFSIKTPNQNTKSIYCYKTAANEGGEITSPLTSTQFQGGINSTGFTGGGSTFSSHRFSIYSPDALVTNPKTAGQQQAFFTYSWGTLGSATPDHGLNIGGALLNDIHGSPTNPGAAAPSSFSAFGGTSSDADGTGVYVVDKLGSIQPTPAVDNFSPGYCVIYNSPSDRDVRSNSNKVVISAMQIRIYYVQLTGGGVHSWGMTPLITFQEPDVVGGCRPQFTCLPDGLPKIIYANFSLQDQYLNIGYQYVESDVLSPARQKRIFTWADGNTIGGGDYTFYAYGKRKCKLIMPVAANFAASQGAGHTMFDVIEGRARSLNASVLELAHRPNIRFLLKPAVTHTSGGTSSEGGVELVLEDIEPYFGFNRNGASIVNTFVYMELYD